MGSEVASALTCGEQFLKDGRLLDAQRSFYAAVDASGKDPAVKLKAAHAWRVAAWAAVMGDDDPENGWTMFHNARALLQSMPGLDAGKLYEVERGMAIAAGKIGDHQDALRCCDEAESHAPGPEERAKVWNTRSISLSILGRYAEAVEWVNRVLTMSKDKATIEVAQQSLGILYIKRGEPKKALPYLKDQVLRAWAHQEAGEFRMALKLAPKGRPRGCTVRARAYLGLGQPSQAITELRRGLKIIEAGRARLDTEGARAFFQGSKQDIPALMIRLCAESRRWGEAFHHAEAARARSFLDFVASGTRRDWTHLRPAERVRFDGLREELETLAKKRSPTSSEARRHAQLEAEYTRSIRRYEKEQLSGSRVQPKEPLSIDQIRRRLGRDETLVQYQVTDDAIYAFTLKRKAFVPIRLSTPVTEILEELQDLSQVIAVARRGERAGRSAFLDWHLQRLRKCLLDELPLGNAKNLVFVPHGPLHQVPFSALRPELHIPVSIAPSASIHVTLAAKANELSMPGRCLMVKDPSGTLPHADAEEAALRECFGKDLTVIEGFAATRDTVLAAAPSHSILHFATHAVYRYDRPEFSHLELAEGEKLLASDILGLNLGNARLVTLSACDSGRGDYSRAEELIGLPRAFLSAGACAVLATLWPVEDHPGIATIMKAFYRALKSSGPRTAASTAQRAARAARIPSTLWSSLVLMGS